MELGTYNILHAVGEEFFFFLKKTLRVSPAYSKEHGRDRDNTIRRVRRKKKLVLVASG